LLRHYLTLMNTGMAKHSCEPTVMQCFCCSVNCCCTTMRYSFTMCGHRPHLLPWANDIYSTG
jgi:hypothetical protein